MIQQLAYGRVKAVRCLDRVVIVGRDAKDLSYHCFHSSTPLIRNLPSQPGKATFPITSLKWPKIRYRNGQTYGK